MRRPWIVVMALALVVAQPATTRAEEPPAHAGPSLTAMSLNLYVGFDVGPIFAARDVQTFQTLAAQAWANVVATDFGERADALAALIDESDADVIGLQEATLWLSGPLFNPAPAETVEYDFTDILVDALADRGLTYDVAVSIDNLDFEAPVVGVGKDLRAIDRDAILVRGTPGSSHLAITNPQAGTFATALTFPFLGGSLTQPRGWVAVDVTHRGQSIRVVNTHLEAFAAPLRDAQAAELLAGPLAGDGNAVLLGDLNARPDGSAPGTYGLLLGDGFIDAWTDANGGGAGFTCCQTPDLAGASTLSQRIDYVLFREASGTSITALGADVIGEEADDRTVSGLWPSDHAGVVANLRIRGDAP